MERIDNIIESFEGDVRLEEDLHCFAIVGNETNYKVAIVGDYDEIGESLYFALCDNPRLLETVADAVHIVKASVTTEDSEYPELEVGEIFTTSEGETLKCIGYDDEVGCPICEPLKEEESK